MVQTVLHLIHPIYFQFYPFHNFPFSALPCSSTVQPNDRWSFTCTFSRCLQYVSVLQKGFFFRHLTGFYFYMSEQKEPLLVVSVVKHTFTTTRIRKLLHTMHVRQLLTASCGIIARQCTVLVFHQEKNRLCWKCVINSEMRSAIFWDLTLCRMAILTTIVLLDPRRCDGYIVPKRR